VLPGSGIGALFASIARFISLILLERAMPLFTKGQKKPSIKQFSIGEVSRELDFLDKQITVGNMQASHEFFKTVRSFFAEYFKIKYKFTYEQLEEELERRRIGHFLKSEFSSFARELSVIEYGGASIEAADVHELIERFGQLIRQLSGEPASRAIIRKEVRFGSVLRAFFSLFDFLPRMLRARGASPSQIEEAFVKAELAIAKQDLIASRAAYLEASRHFNSMEQEEKKKHYDRVISLYNRVMDLHKSSSSEK